MNRNNLIGWIFLVICTIAAPLHAQNPVKVKGAQGRWQVSEEITLKEAEERAFMEAKKEALRKPVSWRMCGPYSDRFPRRAARSFTRHIHR